MRIPLGILTTNGIASYCQTAYVRTHVHIYAYVVNIFYHLQICNSKVVLICHHENTYKCRDVDGKKLWTKMVKLKYVHTKIDVR